MLNVQKYLKENSIVKLTEEYGIKVSSFVTKKDKVLYALNYSMVDSPKLIDGNKLHPITSECRSLVIDEDYNVVSRSFDRFLNMGETGCKLDINSKNLTFTEKADGSLISVFQYDGDIYWRTKSMVNPINVNVLDSLYTKDDGLVQDVTWGQIFDYSFSGDLHGESFIETEDVKQYFSNNPNDTIILEMCTKYNKVVINYEKPSLKLLAIRDNVSGEYTPLHMNFARAFTLNVGAVKHYNINNIELAKNVIETYNKQSKLDEGFVIYDSNVPVGKLKNPLYVAAHHMKGEVTPTRKMAANMVIANETDEFLSLFPEYEPLLTPFINAFDDLITTCDIMLTLISKNNLDFNDKSKRGIFVKNLKSLLGVDLPNDQQKVVFGIVMNSLLNNCSVRDTFFGMNLETAKRNAIYAFLK